MQDVLQFEATFRRGDQWRGPCPVHGSRSPGSRSFSVNVRLGRYHGFRSGSHGNALELWAVVHHFSGVFSRGGLVPAVGLGDTMGETLVAEGGTTPSLSGRYASGPRYSARSRRMQTAFRALLGCLGPDSSPRLFALTIRVLALPKEAATVVVRSPAEPQPGCDSGGKPHSPIRQGRPRS